MDTKVAVEWADQIMAFFHYGFGRLEEIERLPDGSYQIVTDVGSSFAFEIVGKDREEVARRFFEHCRSCWRRLANDRGPSFLQRIGMHVEGFFSPQLKPVRERIAAWHQDVAYRKMELAQMDGFAEVMNLS